MSDRDDETDETDPTDDVDDGDLDGDRRDLLRHLRGAGRVGGSD
jgi:hypothetical protein